MSHPKGERAQLDNCHRDGAARGSACGLRLAACEVRMKSGQTGYVSRVRRYSAEDVPYEAL